MNEIPEIKQGTWLWHVRVWLITLLVGKDAVAINLNVIGGIRRKGPTGLLCTKCAFFPSDPFVIAVDLREPVGP